MDQQKTEIVASLQNEPPEQAKSQGNGNGERKQRNTQNLALASLGVSIVTMIMSVWNSYGGQRRADTSQEFNRPDVRIADVQFHEGHFSITTTNVGRTVAVVNSTKIQNSDAGALADNSPQKHPPDPRWEHCWASWNGKKWHNDPINDHPNIDPNATIDIYLAYGGLSCYEFTEQDEASVDVTISYSDRVGNEYSVSRKLLQVPFKR